ncbi:MAG: hypothetical protein IJ794_19185 [Lachnospiraceae bacterium]|nr:hypothetical protein [Lachnospiraceae bacterium]
MKNGSLADKIIIGFLLMLGMAEIGHLLMVFGHRPFSDAVCCFVVEAIVLVLGGAGVAIASARRTGRKASGAGSGKLSGARSGKASGTKAGGARKKWTKRGHGRAGQGFSGKDITPRFAGIGLVFLLLVLFQVMTITSGEKLVIRGDQTIETVQSMLETDGIYMVNPLTGRPYTAGIPKRIQILGLPTFYGILCRLIGMIVRDELRGGGVCETLLVGWVPLAMLGLTYLAHWTVAKVLFPEEKDREKRMLFLAVVAAVFCVGNYAFGLDGFGLLYCGYRGVAIRNGILLPYTVGLMLRNKWKIAVFCILAEACIVWTLYGMGACLVVVVGMALVRMWIVKKRGVLCAAGEEV